MKYISRLFLVLGLFILSIPYKTVYADTMSDYLNNIAGPSGQYSTSVSPAYLRNNNEEEYINPQNGDLMISQTDYSLPGRNGLNLDIKRIYKSGISNVHEMRVSYNSSNGTWVDYIQSDATTASFYENRYGLGVGERFSFPTIELKQNGDGTSEKYLHTESGDVYRLTNPTLINNIYTYSLENHPVKDLEVREDSTYANGQSDGTSKYVMIEKNGKKTYFSSDGRILAIKDRYSNLIKFEYGTYTYTVDGYTRNRRLINKITDTIGRIINIDYKEDQNFLVTLTSESTCEGNLQGKFQVIVYLPDNTPNDLTDNKKIVYDKTCALYSSNSLHSIRERIQTVYDIDGKIKYHYWFEQPNLGFTYANGNNRTVTNRYENLTQINYYKSNKLKRYCYGSYFKRLGTSGSMEFRKVTQVQSLSKTGYDASQPDFFDEFLFDTKNVDNYTYTNEPDGYGTSGYNASDDNYLRNTYKFWSEKTDSRGTKTKYTYDGVNQLISVESYGNNHKEVTTTTYDSNKLPQKQKKQIYNVSNGQVSGSPVTEVENYSYDVYGNLSSYTGPIANRDSNDNPSDGEHTVNYTYATDKYHILTSKTWKIDGGTTAKLEYDVTPSGNLIQERDIHTGNNIIIDYQYDAYGNVIKKSRHNADNSGNTYVTNYEYGIDADGTNLQGAYLTKQYGSVDGTEVSSKYIYDFYTGNKKADINANGKRTNYEYDVLSRLTKITYPDSTTKQYVYNDISTSDKQIKIIDAKNNGFTYSYDIFGNLTKYDEGYTTKKRIEYDSVGNKIKETDARYNSYCFSYDSGNRLISKSFLDRDNVQEKNMTLAYSTGYGDTYNVYKYNYSQNLTYTYHGYDVPVNTTYNYIYSFDAYISPDANTLTTGTTLIADGENGFICSFSYDNTKKGTWQHFEYTAKPTTATARILIYPTKSTIPATKGYIMYRNIQFKQAGSTNNLFTTTTDNNSFSVRGNGSIECINSAFKIQTTDEEKNVKNQYYDKDNRLLMTEDVSSGAINQYTYDYVGNKISATDGLNHISTFVYDDQNRLEKQRDALNNEIQHAYDAGNNLISTKNAKSIYYYNEYDSIGRLIRKKEPAADGSIAITRYIYDAAGNKTKEIAPKNYDSAKDTPALVNSMLGISYEYDNMNRKIKTIDADKNAIQYIKYDPNGNIEKVVDGLRYNGNIDTSVGTTYAYDLNNRVIQITDPLVNSKYTTYDYMGNITSVKDANGNETVYEYNYDNTLKKVTFPDLGYIEYTYDRLGQKKTEKDQRRNVTSYFYNSLGKITNITDPYQNTVVNQYDSAGNLISSKDKRGNYTYFSYDANNRLIQKKTPLEEDAAKSIFYSIEGYTYDALGNLLSKDLTGTKDASSHRITTYTYYDNNLLNTTTDNNGAYKKNYYDKNRNLVKTEVLRDTGKNDISKYVYDNMDRLIKDIRLIDEADIYNASSLPNITNLRDTEYSGKIQRITGYNYDILGNKIKELAAVAYGYLETDTANRDKYTTSYSYDLLNRLEKTTWKYNGNDVYSQLYYDAAGNKIKERNERGNNIQYTYDSMNRVKTITDARGKPYTYNYDLAGNKVWEMNSKNNKISYEYDNLNRLVTTKDPYDKVISQKVYDANGNVIKEIDAKGYISAADDNARYGTSYTYNLANLLVKVVDPEVAALGDTNLFTEKYEYNQYGEKTKTLDALNNPTTYQYDLSGRLTTVTVPQTNPTTYTYDKAGNKVSMVNGKQKETKYSYIDFGKLKSMTDADNAITNYQYDMNLNLAKVVDGNTNTTQYTYDNQNQMLSRTVSQTGDSVGYSYDELGNKTGMTDSTGARTYIYNENNWLLNELKEGITQISYSYDDTGNIMSVTDGKGFVTSYTYDNSNRMSTAAFNGKVTNYYYDENGNRKSVVYPGGITEEYGCDKVDRIVSVTNKISSSNVVISSYAYTYYNNGLQKSKKDQSGTTTNYNYDGAGRITQVSFPGNTKDYTYDNAGNRETLTETCGADQSSGYVDETIGSEVKYRIKSSKYTYSNANKLIRNIEYMKDAAGNELLEKINSYFYDKNGNELSVNSSYVKNSTTAQISLSLFNYDTSTTAQMDSKIDLTNNEYDGFNRLIKVDSIKNGKRTITEYVYNGDDLRVKKTVKNSSNNYTPSVTNYFYDGQHVIMETDNSNNVKARYIRGINYIARLDGQNKISYYFYNGHGDVVQTVSENGTKENQYDYDAFGQPISIFEAYGNAIRYAGEYYDTETGLYYLRARYYDPSTGRFKSEDSYWGEDSNPLSLNLYTYCENDPIRFIDPSGHMTEDLQGDVVYNPHTGQSHDSEGNLVGDTNVLKYDSKNYSEETKELQNLLNGVGIKVDVDGYFGEKTKAAVMEFQRQHGLTVDGVVGPNTWAALLPAPVRKPVSTDGTGNGGTFIEHGLDAADTFMDSFLNTITFGNIGTDDVGAFFLMMDKDEDGNFHARPDCWQQFVGYNDFYDYMFDLGTDMKRAKFQFSDAEEDYILWAWKGDYINLGAGAELGIYKRAKINSSSIEKWVVDKNLALPMPLKLSYNGNDIINYISAKVNSISIEKWDVDKNLVLPMSLKLSYNGNDIINYNPSKKQWWITGFNPEYKNIAAEELTATFTVNFSGKESMYKKFIKSKDYLDSIDQWSSSESNEYIMTFTFK